MTFDDIDGFLLISDFELFCDKGLLRKKTNYFMGSQNLERCYKISEELYSALSIIEGLLKSGQIKEGYEKIEPFLSREGYIQLVKKLDTLGFNECSQKSIMPYDRFDESKLTMIRLFTIKGVRFNYTPRISYTLFRWLYLSMVVLCTFFCWHNLTGALGLLNVTSLSIGVYIIVYILSYLLHELAHVVAARFNGVDIKEINCAFYFNIIPIFFVKYRNIRFFTCKQRLSISLAGIAINMLLLLIALACSSISGFQEFCVATIYVNFMMIVSCMMPMKLGDGYFVLCDLLGVDNLRKYIFSFALHYHRGARKNIVHTIYFVVFLVFNGVSLMMLGVSVLRIWGQANGIFRMFIILNFAFTLLICCLTFAKRVFCEKSMNTPS